LHCNVFLYQRLASCSMGGTLVGILITDGLDPEWRYTSSISLCGCSCANCLWDRKYPSLIPVSYDPCQIYTGQRHWRRFSGHRGPRKSCSDDLQYGRLESTLHTLIFLPEESPGWKLLREANHFLSSIAAHSCDASQNKSQSIAISSLPPAT